MYKCREKTNMEGLYNQSTLKRMKKDDLIQLYLDCIVP